jgi:sporulation protein YqfC
MKKLQELYKSIAPEEILPNNSLFTGRIRLTLTGCGQLLVENFRGLICFDTNQMVISSHKEQVTITGKALKILYFTGDEILLTGKIEKITLKEWNG